ncbi:hypothetical protein [Rothia uropygialis]|nr:hypothetical protein [Kocuria sp. 36]
MPRSSAEEVYQTVEDSLGRGIYMVRGRREMTASMTVVTAVQNSPLRLSQ